MATSIGEIESLLEPQKKAWNQLTVAQKKTLRTNFMFQSQKSKKHPQTRQITQLGKNQI